MTETIPETFDLYWLQTLGGGGDAVRRGIPVRDALSVLVEEQAKAARGEYGAGVVVYLRPSGQERDWSFSIAAFRACLLDIADPEMTIRQLRMRLYLARDRRPEQALNPHEIAAYINKLAAPPTAPTEFRKDGWPLCPICQEDELWSPFTWDGEGEKPPIEAWLAAGLSCYKCGWTNKQ